ncbi:ABC transporter ATP-binding protein [Candidatus Mycoplasma mahonii]|uniref:ABC transporter ATP-binding protein n=1 Tax=Candidatus Mycoplasma mahonii TaxID=3004105 RepID=UPI0026F08F3A|nr:ABC transporter ATP-binding protein [Candidatus Mycoplasma mahonii]WKX02384.1 ABC transporter ATP-binding protein [Candidatus Mycoplasma mahonii]
MFNIKNINFKYSKKTIIEKISASFKQNAFTSILGPNGSGKTTLIKIMMKLLKQQKGEIDIDDKNISTFKSKEYAKKVAYIPQQITFPVGTTVFDFVAYGRNPHTNIIGMITNEDKTKVKEALELCGISHLQDKFITLLSGGQKQMCAIALTMAQDAQIILLDEPNSYLDIYHVDEIMTILKHLINTHNKTIILTIHDINQASKFSDYILMMSKGKIVDFDTPIKVITKKNLKNTFHVNAKIIKNEGKPFILNYTRYEEDHAKDDI